MITMKRLLSAMLLAAVAFTAAAQNFENLFDGFAKESSKDYAAFQDEANKRFVSILKGSWIEFKVLDAVEYPHRPKPKTAPVAPAPEVAPVREPNPVEAPVASADPDTASTPETSPVVNHSPEEEVPFVEDAELPAREVEGTRPCMFSFYNSEVRLWIPEAVSAYRMRGNSEKDVAGFWEVMSQSDYRYVLSQVEEYATRMGLEGWSLYLFVERLSGELFGSDRPDEVEVFKTFILNQMGVSARMGLADGRLMTTVSVKEQLYARLFYKYEGLKYYFGKDVKEIKEFRSYPGEFAGNLAQISVEIPVPLHLGGKDDVQNISKPSKVFGSTLSLPVNTALCGFYLDFPQVDVDVYARAAYGREFSSALLESLRPCLEERDELTNVNMLLRFLQYDFEYSTDDDQFGYEKPFFLEENFVYPANDCEDRSILFSYLVKNLLGLDVVLLNYPNHVATAVCFNEDVAGDSASFNGRRFTICDPTYIGSYAGMTMPGCGDVQFKVLPLFD